jgi:hypothetical protein
LCAEHHAGRAAKVQSIPCALASGRIVIAVLPPGFVTPGALTARHVGVAPPIVDNNPETMERSRRSFPTAAGGPSSRRRCVTSLGQNALASFGQNAPLSPLVPSPSRSRIYPTSAVTSTALAGPISRCQTAHLVPAARSCARGLQPCFAHPESRGGRSAEKRSGVIRQALARRLASHDAGRSPLGAPPWRFFTRGRASVSGIASGSVQRAPRSQVVVPGGRGPGPPGASSCEPPPQDATPRSAFGSPLEDAPR